MNKSLGVQLLAYSALLIGSSYWAYHIAPGLGGPVIRAGLAGGGLCIVWGLAALAGRRGKALPILTLMGVSFVLLAQTVTGWFEHKEGVPGHWTAVLVITGLFLLSIGMLMRIAYAGFGGAGRERTSVVPERPVPETLSKRT